MAKKKAIEAKNQAKIQETRDAKNAENGFKMSVSAGTKGIGDNRKR